MSTPSTNAILDRSQFDVEITHLALKVRPNQCSHYLTAWKSFLFKRPKMKSIYNSEDNLHRFVILQQEYQDPTLSFAPSALREEHFAQGGTVESYVMKLGYEHLSAEEVLRKLLPSELSEIPSSFEQAGHIAHMNLRDESLPYKYLIGQVIVDKNPNIRTVVNKIGQIETEFRTFPLEVIAGDDDMVVTLKESNAIFTFNFADVYWNSRLQMEHHRVINMIKDRVSSFHQLHASHLLSNNNHSADNSVAKGCDRVWKVADMMGGVGPFAVPLAQAALQTHSLQQLHQQASGNKSAGKKGPMKVSPGMMIHANDLNPASYKYLVINQEKNHVKSSLVPYNLDGRVFLRDLVGRQGVWPDEAIMNLPQNATDFLDVFIGLGHLYDQHWEQKGEQKCVSEARKSLRIHVYAFSTHPEDPIGDIVQRSAGIMRCRPDEITATEEGVESGCLGHIVRDVAPKKVMVCLSFFLPQSVMYNATNDATPSICGKRSADHL